MATVVAKKVETRPAVNAAGEPLHPVCRDAQGRTHLVAKVGHLYLTCVVLPQGRGQIHVTKLDACVHGLTELQMRKGDNVVPYPVNKAVRMFLKFAKEKGITDGARDALEELKGEKEQVSAPAQPVP